MKMHTNCDKNFIVSKFNKYQRNLTEINDFIEEKKNSLKTGKADEELKTKLLKLIRHTIDILEEYY